MLKGLRTSTNFIKYLEHRFATEVKDCSLTTEDLQDKIDFYIDGVPIQFKSRTKFVEVNLEFKKYLPYSKTIVDGRDKKIQADYLIFYSEILPYFSIIPIQSIQEIILNLEQTLEENIDLMLAIDSRINSNQLLFKNSQVTIILQRDTNHHGVLYKVVGYCPLELFKTNNISMNNDILHNSKTWADYNPKETLIL